MFAARVGDLESAKLLVAAGANVNDTDAWGVSAATLAAHSDFRAVAEFLLDKGADASAAKAGFSALHLAIMHRDVELVRSLLTHKADPNAKLATWTPNRRSANDFYFEPELVGATPLWLAARFTVPGAMKLLIEHGADPLFIHQSEKMAATQTIGFELKKQKTTILMAAVGMGGGVSWATPKAEEKEALTLEAVKMLVERGVDVNVANTDGRTALDAGRSMASVATYLTEHGAKGGAPAAPRGARGAAR
jgi:ankyrin repeat protein